MAQLHRTNGAIEEYPAPANGKDYTLQELRDAIGGGYIEILPLSDGRLMVIDEEGKPKTLPGNAQATNLYRQGRDTMDFIVGDALVCEKDQID